MMKWSLLTISLAAVVQTNAMAPEAHQKSVATPHPSDVGVEFTTDPNGTIRFDEILFQPNADEDDFDDTTFYTVLALQPDKSFISGSRSEHTQVDYLGEAGGRPEFSAAIELEHGWVYARRVDVSIPTPDEEFQQQTVPVEELVGPHWPIVIIKDIGAGAEGTDFMVVRREDPDSDNDVVYVLFMDGHATSRVWVIEMSDPFDPENPDQLKSMYGRNMNDYYIRVIFDRTATNPTYAIEKRHLLIPSRMDDWDMEAKRIRDEVLERRQFNRDKFWNPGVEAY